MTCEVNNCETEWSLCSAPDVILCCWLGSKLQLTNACLCLSLCVSVELCLSVCLWNSAPQCGAADAEIKVPSDENTEPNRSPFKAWSRSVYGHTCYTYFQGFLSSLFLPFQSIHLHFFQNLSRSFPVLAFADAGSCVGLQNKIGHPAGCSFPCCVPAEYK